MMFDDNLQHLVRRILRTLNTPRALSVFLMMQYGEWDQITELRADPANYEHKFHHGVERYRRDVQATELIRKSDFLPTSFDRAEVARRSFLETERQCCETNLRLDRFLGNPVTETALERRADELFKKARNWISHTLGDVPDCLNGRFGPGAVFESESWKSASRKGITGLTKLRKSPTHTANVSSELIDHLVWQSVLSQAWQECCPNRLFPITRGSRFATVPKDSTKDRSIAVEPGINVLGQLAVGEAMKHRLKRRGLDLQHGQALHRRMAAEASVTDYSATIDLSNASNTVSRALVKLLLPESWYDLLSELRCPLIRFSPTGKKRDARWQRLEMFSSMGNGYTFELETLIFAGLLHACGCKIGVDTFVYGDDMIVPVERVPDALALLQYSGFTPNKKKTFTHGVFRESCGGDFLFGHDVRPFYIKEAPNESADWMVLANSLWDWSLKWDLPELQGPRSFCLDQLPNRIRALRGPKALGDSVLWDHQHNWSCRIRNSIRWFRVWRPVSRLNGYAGQQRKYVDYRGRTVRYVESTEPGVCIAASILGYSSEGVAPRESVAGWRFGRVAYS